MGFEHRIHLILHFLRDVYFSQFPERTPRWEESGALSASGDDLLNDSKSAESLGQLLSELTSIQ